MEIFDTQKSSSGWIFDFQNYFPPSTMQGDLEVVELGITHFTVAWEPAVPTAGGIAHYEVRINGGAYVAVGLDRTYQFTWVQAAYGHEVSVRALDTLGKYSPPLTATVTTAAYPTAAQSQVLINKRLADPAAVTTVVVFPKVT